MPATNQNSAASALPTDLDRALHAGFILGWGEPRITDELRGWLEGGLGGIILHTRNVDDAGQLQAMIAEMRAIQPGLLVTVDQEGGGIGHLTRAGAPDTPGNWALGVADDLELTAGVARSLADHLRQLGINVSYSPVVDVQRIQRNPIVRTRSFGADPGRVSRHAAAWIRGTDAAGVASCAKHFPGHGSTTVDSHLATAIDARPLSDLDGLDLAPFREAIAAGVPQLMTAHVLFSAVDDRPATLSRRILTELLREELRFEGLLVTDALEMKAIADSIGEVRGGVEAFKAGADQVIVAEPDPALHQRVLDGLRAAVAAGELPEERIREAAGRVAVVADRYRVGGPVAAVEAADLATGLEAARRAVRVTGTVTPLQRPFVVDLYREPNRVLEWDGWDLVTFVRDVCPGADGVGLTGASTGTSSTGITAAGTSDSGIPGADELLARSEGRPLVLATQDVDIHPWQRELRDAILARRPDAYLVETGLPGNSEADAGTAAGETADDGIAGPVSGRSFGRGRANLTAVADLFAST